MGFSEEGSFNQSSLHTVYREDFIAERCRGEGWVISNKCSHPLIDLFVDESGFLLTVSVSLF